MSWTEITLLATSVPIIFGLIAPKLRLQFWWVRAWEYARQQLVLFMVIHICAIFIFADIASSPITVLLGLELTILFLNLADLVAFTPLFAKEVALSNDTGGEKISVLLFNVLQDNDDYSSALAMLLSYEADIIFLCETSSVWMKRLADLEKTYPHRHEMPAENYNGLLFYSRFEILAVQEHYFSQSHIPSLSIKLKAPSGEHFSFFALHPRPPRPEDATEKLDKEILKAAQEISNISGPILVGGDLNEVCWSPTFREMKRKTGLMDPRVGRGVFNTYHAARWYVSWPIDHLLMSEHFTLKQMETGPACGSDHHAMYFETVLKTQSSIAP